MAKIILFTLAALIAILYQLEADPSYWTAHSTVRLDVVPEEVMRFLTNVDQMEKVFSDPAFKNFRHMEAGFHSFPNRFRNSLKHSQGGASDSDSDWFALVSYVRQADFKPVGISKQYHAIYNIPWLGEYAILFKVVEHEANTILYLESEHVLKPRVEFIIKQPKFKETYLTIRIQYRRNSILFQYTLSPLLYFVTSQQLHQSLFTLRMLFPY